MVEKVGFTNCVFEKLCLPHWKHYFYSVFSKTQLLQKQKLYVEKNRKFMKNSGLFLSMAEWCFLGVCRFFWGFKIKRFVFGVSGIVSKVLKILVFSQFLLGFLVWFVSLFIFLVSSLLFSRKRNNIKDTLRFKTLCFNQSFLLKNGLFL